MRSGTDLLTARPLDERDIFRHFLHDFHALQRSLRGRFREVWHPPTDVYETDSDIVIKMSVPGVRAEEIAVECNGQVITICGVRRGPNPSSIRRYHQMEIRNGYFERRIVMHRPFNPDAARAQYEDGFLHVFLPLATEPVTYVRSIRFRF